MLNEIEQPLSETAARSAPLAPKNFHKNIFTLAAFVRGVTLAGAIGVILWLPAIWLYWEGTAAQTRASVVAEAARMRVEASLRGMLEGFDRATVTVGAEQEAGDSVTLTGRLLLVEPMAAPAIDLVVVDVKGQQIAASSLRMDATDNVPWWTAGLAALPARGAGVLGCGHTAVNGADLMIARRITDASGRTVGAVAGTLSTAALRDLVVPTGADVSMMMFSLTDAAGCSIVQKQDAGGPIYSGTALVRFYRALLPAGWGKPNGVVVTARASNLAWAGTITPDAAMRLRGGDFDHHAVVLQATVLALIGLVLLLEVL
jgi:hypothetical protein